MLQCVCVLLNNMPTCLLTEVLDLVFTKCIEDDGRHIEYCFDFIEDDPQQPAIEEPAPMEADDDDSRWLEDVTSASTELEQQDDPPSYPLTLMVSK